MELVIRKNFWAVNLRFVALVALLAAKTVALTGCSSEPGPKSEPSPTGPQGVMVLPAVQLPETPAGKKLDAWVAAINAGSRAKLVDHTQRRLVCVRRRVVPAGVWRVLRSAWRGALRGDQPGLG